MVSVGQIVVLILAIAVFVAGGIISLARLRWNNPPLRVAERICLWGGIAVSIAVLAWHASVRTAGSWLPLDDNFEALLWLAILLAGFVLYIQTTRPVPGVDWFILPGVVAMLAMAGHFGSTNPKDYIDTAWSVVHRITSFGGTVAFLVAGASGAMYLLVSRRLRNKSAFGHHNMGNLERLERQTNTAVVLGFAMMTVGLAAGFIWQARIRGSSRLGPHWYVSPKVLLAVAVWLIYAVVLHARIAPILRGRKVAILSIVGCVLTFVTVLAIMLMPGGAH